MKETFQNRYKIIKEIGRGAMGTVFLARDIVLETDCALKIIPCSGNETEFQRFQREVLSTRRVASRFVVKTFECGIADGLFYLVSEYVDGGNLRDYLEHHSLSLATKLKIFTEIAQGLKDLHDSGVIHRDIKLSNILFDTLNQIPKIGDLGISKFGEAGLTTKGEFIGSATHMAPELWQGETATEKSDIYALGILGYELFAEKLPFSKKELFSIIDTHKRGVFPDLSEISQIRVPQDLNRVVKDCLVKEPVLRPTAGQLVLRLSCIRFGDDDIQEKSSLNNRPDNSSTLFVKGQVRASATAETLTRTLEEQTNRFLLTLTTSVLGVLMLLIATSGLPALVQLSVPLMLDKAPFITSLVTFLVIGISFFMAFVFDNKALAVFLLVSVMTIGTPMLVQSFQAQVFADEHGTYLVSLESLSRNLYFQSLSQFSPYDSTGKLNPAPIILILCVSLFMTYLTKSLGSGLGFLLSMLLFVACITFAWSFISSLLVASLLFMVGFLAILRLNVCLNTLRST